MRGKSNPPMGACPFSMMWGLCVKLARAAVNLKLKNWAPPLNRPPITSSKAIFRPFDP
jgi:hypothetical protein